MRVAQGYQHIDQYSKSQRQYVKYAAKLGQQGSSCHVQQVPRAGLQV